MIEKNASSEHSISTKALPPSIISQLHPSISFPKLLVVAHLLFPVVFYNFPTKQIKEPRITKETREKDEKKRKDHNRQSK
jgi:hypothetical protein